MIKGIVFFVLLWSLVAAGITLFRDATNKKRWSAVRLAAFGFATAVIAAAIVVSIVVIF
jgi:hypothetical protein